ncbi:MAG: hypothetical protein WCK65_08225 [Rhodospirillaceae bacterium]
MSTTTFDKLLYFETLKSSGVSEEQAKAHAHALDEALRDSVATKSDIKDVMAAIEIAQRDLKLWTAGLAGLVIAAMSAIKFVGH